MTVVRHFMMAVVLVVAVVAATVFVSGTTPAFASQVGDSAATIALSQLGPNYSTVNIENPMGSGCNKYTGALAGHSSGCAPGFGNRGDYGFAWCADFATWVWKQAGANIGGLNDEAYSFYAYGVANGTWHPAGSGYTPQPGDAVVYGLNTSTHYAAHVGIVATSAGPGVVQGNWWYNWPSKPAEWGVAWDAKGVDLDASPSGYVTPVAGSPGPSGGSGRVLGSSCLGLHLGPDGTAPQVACIPPGTTVTISCVRSGQSVTGPYGAEATWDHTSYNGEAGFVSDAWIYTGSNSPVAGSCGGNGVAMVQGCLTMRAGPYLASAEVGCIAQAASFTINCTAPGDSVTGPYGATTLWDHTSYGGASGYVSDAFVYTGTASAVAGPCPATVAPPQINQGSLPNGVTGQHYDQQFTVTGGTSPYTFSVAASSLPPGLTLTSSGDLSGTPTTPGGYSFTVSVTDSERPAVTTQRGYTLTIVAASQPDLNIGLHRRGAFRHGRNATYKVRVVNAGNASATREKVIIHLPAGMTRPRGHGTRWACRSHGRRVVCVHRGQLRPAEAITVTLRIHITARKGRRLTTRATVTPAGSDTNNTARNTVRIR